MPNPMADAYHMRLRQGRHKAIAALEHQGKLVPLGQFANDAAAYATMITNVGAMFEAEARAAGYEPSAELVDGVAEMAMDEYGWSMSADEWAVFLRDLFGGKLAELYGLRRDIIGRALRTWLHEWRPLVYDEIQQLREAESLKALPAMSEEEIAENQARIRAAIQQLRERLTQD